jgi:hypothetical protein
MESEPGASGYNCGPPCHLRDVSTETLSSRFRAGRKASNKKTKLRGISPQANNTNRGTAAFRQNANFSG